MSLFVQHDESNTREIKGLCSPCHPKIENRVRSNARHSSSIFSLGSTVSQRTPDQQTRTHVGTFQRLQYNVFRLQLQGSAWRISE